MNLTNDNPLGCKQIAACGGLETMVSVIAGHFPMFSSSSSLFSDRKEKNHNIGLDHEKEKHLTDQELDFLVAILGLLVNLVEKDGSNRSSHYLLLLVHKLFCLKLLLGNCSNA